MPICRSAVFALAVAVLFLSQSPVFAEQHASSGTWTDGSPHKSEIVQANGIHLHYLDWGGHGKTLLFLADLGYTAHIFDDIAPKFTDHYHVLGLTRRGHGQSDKPSSGYDNDTLMEDLRGFLDKKGLARVILAGHGLAGTEMTHFARTYRDRVEKLIYLDAAYDSEDTEAVLDRFELTLKAAPAPPFPTHDSPTFDAIRGWAKSRLGCWSNAMEAEVRTDIVRHADGTIEDVMPGFVEAALRRNATVSASDFRNVTAPALGIFAMDSVGSVFPWVTPTAADEKRKAAQEFVDFGNRQKREQIARFRNGGANRRILELPDTVHHCFISRQDDVVRAMRAFLAE